MIDPQTKQILLLATIAVSVGGVIFAVALPYFSGAAQSAKRVKGVASASGKGQRTSLKAKAEKDTKDHRRKQIQATLKQFEEQSKTSQKRLTLPLMIAQAGLDITISSFWIFSLVVGVAIGVAMLIFGAPVVAAAGGAFVGGLGLPRWFINFLRKKRQAKFIADFADAIDVMVRGLKAGLPVSDAMKVIASETGPPVGPEFIEVVEGQRVGITMQQGLERMFERMPLAEVNFLAIVMTIQAKTGGNLSESLANLSRVLRDRRKMKQKIKAVSQEAVASAGIIASLPFLITGAMTILNPAYLLPLWETDIGNLMVGGCILWMMTGVLVMRGMINFDI